MRHIIFTIFIWFIFWKSFSQSCSVNGVLGQTASTAFPVCGTQAFAQTTVPFCRNGDLPVACNDGAAYGDKNPFWYKFTCFTSGTLGFAITPNNLNDDYDWVLYDVTNHPPDDVYTVGSLAISSNWSSRPGVTGTSSGGSGNLNCAGPTFPNENVMPSLIAGHNYLLMVSHFDDTQNGYSLSFGGGTAVITDPINPALQSARAICDGQTMGVKLNKKMKCSSLATNGTDFKVTPNAPVASAVGYGCATGFDTDSITLTLANSLPPGNYIITAKNGIDGNTMLDICDRQIPIGDNKTVTVFPQFPTPMDSISPVGCKPTQLHLVFKKLMQCSSIAADGSDFKITGPRNIVVSSAAGVCDSNGTAFIINVNLATPISVAGTYTITLKTGTDGNTILNECGQPTAAGSFLNFVGYDTVSAKFPMPPAISFDCKNTTLQFAHNGGNGINFWSWVFALDVVNVGNLSQQIISTSNLQNPTPLIFNVPNDTTLNIQLAVSNGVCTDTVRGLMFVPNPPFYLKAGVVGPYFICPTDTVVFTDASVGKIISNWAWDFANGNTSNLQKPPMQFYPVAPISQTLMVRLIASNQQCADTAFKKVILVNNCLIDVPTGFTPNGDGLNDFLYPLNAYKADNLVFRIYNRLGQLVYETKDWTKKWDGKINGNEQPTGAYVWTLEYTHHDTGKHVSLKGTSVLIR